MLRELEAERARLVKAIEAASIRVEDFDRMIKDTRATIARSNEIIEADQARISDAEGESGRSHRGSS